MANESTWLLIGQVAQQMGDLDHAHAAYDHVLRHNPVSLAGLTHAAAVARVKENYPKAIDYFQRALNLQEDNGEVWSALGHCYLMQDDLQKAYSAYQQALYMLPNPKEDPKLWYGIGILYDRYGSLDHAEEAFASVLRMSRDLDLDKENEILFRLGIIYKQQMKYSDAIHCFDNILRNPPSPLAHADIWFQIGHVYEQQKDLVRAKDAYEKVVLDSPMHAKVLQQLGWLYHQDESSFQNQDVAIQYLTKSLEADPSDAQSWYLLGRAYMAGQKYNKAYEAYQQAVYRDGRNPTFWCSIGVLYFQINQFRDALDAYSRAIRINPYISEVWFDLGTLYESCNNQISDAIDAYARAHELDRTNAVIAERLQVLRNAQVTGEQLPAAPGPQDVHPTAYANAIIAPPGLTGPPPLSRQLFGPDPRGPGQGGHDHPSGPSSGRTPPGPFRGGPPPPVILDDSHHSSSHNALAPMNVDRVSHGHDLPPTSREHGRGGGPANSHSILLHHPVPQPLQDDIRKNGAHSHHESYFSRPPRPSSASSSPTTHHRMRAPSPPPSYSGYPHGSRQSLPPTPSGPASGMRSPRPYPSREPSRRGEPEPGWDRRAPPPAEPREYERRPRVNSDYGHPPPGYYQPHSPTAEMRTRSPGEPPRSASAQWEKPTASSSRPYHHSPVEPPLRRYDPRHDAVRDSREPRGREEIVLEPRGGPMPSFDNRQRPHHSQHYSHPPPAGALRAESRPPSPGSDGNGRRRSRAPKDKDAMVVDQPPPPKKERKRRAPAAKRGKDDMESGTSAPRSRGYSLSKESPEPSTSSHSSSKPSPTSAGPHPHHGTPALPSRVVDEDYDEGVAETLIGLSSYRAPEGSNGSHDPSGPSAPQMKGSRRPENHATMKRPLSPSNDEGSDHKRARSEVALPRHHSPSGEVRVTPAPSTRPSPIPFRTQPTSHSPESRQRESYPASPPLPGLPPHPRPVGAAGLSSSHTSVSNNGINLPPIATLSPPSTVASPPPSADRDQDEIRRPSSGADRSRSTSPKGKLAHPNGSPQQQRGPTPPAGRDGA